MNLRKTMFATLTATILTAGAVSAMNDFSNDGSDMGYTPATIGALPDGDTVELMGTVTDVNRYNQEFTLSDATGSIGVKTPRSSELVLGDRIVVRGDVNHRYDGNIIEAHDITIKNDAAYIEPNAYGQYDLDLKARSSDYHRQR